MGSRLNHNWNYAQNNILRYIKIRILVFYKDYPHNILFSSIFKLPVRSSSVSLAILATKKKKKETQRMSVCCDIDAKGLFELVDDKQAVTRFIGWFRCDRFTLTHYSKSHSTFVNQICKLVRVAFAISADLADRFFVNRFEPG